jgi:hypothetical protein
MGSVKTVIAVILNNHKNGPEAVFKTVGFLYKSKQYWKRRTSKGRGFGAQSLPVSSTR